MSHDEVQPPKWPAENSVRQRIIAEARRHFFIHGFRRVTMDDLAEGLGMSKKTLYTHFSSKIALVEAVLLHKLRDIEEELEQITAECSSDFLKALHPLLACLQRQTSEIQPPFLRDVRREAPEMVKVVENRRREIFQRHFGKILEGGRRAGVFRKDISAELVLEILLSAVQAIMNPAKMEEFGLTPNSGFTSIIKVILEGVLTKEGRTIL